MPRTFSAKSRRNFVLDRRRRYLERLPGPPNHVEAARIEALVRLEWSALRAEREGTIAGDREAREHRRLFDRLLSDFERSLQAPAKPLPKTYRDLVAERGR